MSASFSSLGNSQFDNDSLKSSRNVVAVVSELNLSILGGVFTEGVVFLGFIVLISFSISETLIASNSKDFSFHILFWMRNILGWISYFLIGFSTGPNIVLESLLPIYRFSSISRVDTAILKKVFSVSVTFSSFCINSSFSMTFIWDLRFPLSEKNGFIVFQKILLSLAKDGLRLQKNSFFFLFYKGCYSSFFVFCNFLVNFLFCF